MLRQIYIAYPAEAILNYNFPNNDHATSQIDPSDPLQQVQLLELPMDMDLSEFMINTDIDILSRYYDVSR